MMNSTTEADEENLPVFQRSIAEALARRKSQGSISASDARDIQMLLDRAGSNPAPGMARHLIVSAHAILEGEA
jgi:hypothetical protein